MPKVVAWTSTNASRICGKRHSSSILYESVVAKNRKTQESTTQYFSAAVYMVECILPVCSFQGRGCPRGIDIYIHASGGNVYNTANGMN